MNRKIICMVICTLLITTVLPAWSMKTSQTNREKSIEATGDEQWPMFHHDVQHTGYTTAVGSISTPMEKWSFSTGGAVASSCAIGGNIGNKLGVGMMVVVGSHDGYVYAADSSGKKIWSRTTLDAIGSSPAIANVDGTFGMEVIIGSNDGAIYVFDGATGEEKWSRTTLDAIDSSPTISDIDNDGKMEVIVGSSDGAIYVFDGATGEEKWSRTTSGAVSSSPAISNNNIYIGSSDHNVYCFDGNTGNEMWNYQTGGEVTSSPAISDGKVYIGSHDKKVYCLDADTGNEMWNYQTGGEVTSTPAIGNVDGTFGNEIVVSSKDGKVYALGASNGAKKWIFTAGGTIESSPAIADIDGDGKNDVVVGSSNSYLYAINSNGNKIWDYKTTGAIKSSPSVSDIDGDGSAEIVFGSDDGNIYALGAGGPLPPKTPERPTGPTRLERDVSYEYCTKTINPVYEEVYYVFDWGDGSQDETECVDPAEGACLTHSWTWEKPGDQYEFCVKVKAVACDPDTGLESDWSSCLQVISKSKQSNNVFVLSKDGSDTYQLTTIEFPNDPPNTPSKPSGPTSLIVHHSYAYQTSAVDPDGDRVQYYFDWGDGEGDWTGFFDSGQNGYCDHIWREPGDYQVKAKARDENGAESDWSEPLPVTVEEDVNPPPKTPERPTGPTGPGLEPGVSYEYCTKTINPIYEEVYYVFDWGDGSQDETECVDPAEGACLKHSWSYPPGKYCVKVKAVACDPDTGLESDWSSCLWVTKSKQSNNVFVLQFLERLIDRFPFLEHNWVFW